MRLEFILSALPFVPSFVVNFFPAGNRFESRPWGGLALPAFRLAPLAARPPAVSTCSCCCRCRWNEPEFAGECSTRDRASVRTMPDLASGVAFPIESRVSPIESRVSPIESRMSPIESRVSPIESSVCPIESRISDRNARISNQATRIAGYPDRRPEPEEDASFDLAAKLRGNTQILPPQPTAGPILFSGLDFPTLLGMPKALAGGKDDLDVRRPSALRSTRNARTANADCAVRKHWRTGAGACSADARRIAHGA